MAIREYDIPTSTRRLIKKTFIGFLILSFAVVAVHGQTVELTLHPAKVAEPAQTYWLLVKADRLIDGDAAPLYEKAIQLMPKGFNQKQFQEWFNLPIEQFPQQQAEEVIQKHLESLRLVARAVRCKECHWPAWEPGTEPPNLSGYRELAFVIRLWARLEISRGQYKNAVIAFQTAFGMARHHGQGPTIVQTLVGGSIGGLMCRELEQYVQGKDAPNLHAALADMPEPLVNVERAIENESATHKDQNAPAQKQHEEQLKTAYDRVRQNNTRLNNHVNALQIVEAIRHYAATHEGQLPQALGDIQDIEVPNDLVSGQVFKYRRTSSGATLQSAIPEGGNERDTVHYEIVLKK